MSDTQTSSNNAKNQTEKQLTETLKEASIKTAEWFFPVVALTYACGFLIVFTFFKGFGIQNVEFIESRYIHIGSLFMMACITIVLPLRWAFIGLHRWYHDDKHENEPRVKAVVKELFTGGQFWSPICNAIRQGYWRTVRLAECRQFIARQPLSRIVRTFCFAEWHVPEKHGMHANFPVIGSVTLMMWCFLLLLTFAKPDFAHTGHHPKLILLNILFPLLITLLAIPGDWLRSEYKDDFLYSGAGEFLLNRRRILRVYWSVMGLGYLFWFFNYRATFDYDLKYLTVLFFGAPFGLIGYVWFRLFYWKDTKNDRNERLKHRLTTTRWLLSPIQWALFLAQCWIFARVIITENLGVSVREVFVGGDWYLSTFPSRFAEAVWHWVTFRQTRNPLPVGGISFIILILLIVFFANRYLYRFKQLKDFSLRNVISAFCLICVLFYFAVLTFARNVYSYIPAAKGGGDYTLSRPVQLTFDSKYSNLIPQEVTDGLRSNALILLDANNNFVFLASTNDDGGPKLWREGLHKPTVYEVRREAVATITYRSASSTNSSTTAHGGASAVVSTNTIVGLFGLKLGNPLPSASRSTTDPGKVLVTPPYSVSPFTNYVVTRTTNNLICDIYAEGAFPDEGIHQPVGVEDLVKPLQQRYGAPETPGKDVYIWRRGVISLNLCVVRDSVFIECRDEKLYLERPH